jgi:uncharacterized protein (DUF1330 family)
MAKGYFIADMLAGAPNEEVLRYRDQVMATLTPFGGRFLSRGGAWQQVEGNPIGETAKRRFVMLEFPSVAKARAWYDSPAYQAILPLRLRNMDGSAVIIEGVPD